MKKYGARLVSVCLILCLLLSSANAISLSGIYDFGFHLDSDGTAWGEWQRRSRGVNFRVKIENFSGYDYVDGFTMTISAQDAYGDPVLLKASDGYWYETLWYSSNISYKPGRVAMSKYFFVQGNETIKKITATIIDYHIKGGRTVEIDPSDYDSRTWTIK